MRTLIAVLAATPQSRKFRESRLPRVGVLVVAISVLSLTYAAKAAPPKVKPANLSVTTTIEDTDSSYLPYTIESDGSGPYQDGSGGVSSILTTNVCNGLTWGDWRFDSSASTSRSVSEGFFSQDAVVAGDSHYQAPAVPPYSGLQFQHSVMNVQCTCTAGRDMYTMTAGAQIQCPLINHWVDSSGNGNTWGFAPAKSFTGFAETTDAQIKCNVASGDHCVDWVIEPIGAPAFQAVGRVVETIPSHGRDIKDDDGDFYMRFKIHVTLP